MEVCPNCFSDSELKGFLGSSQKMGNCKVCKAEDASLTDIAELLDFFQELVDNFKPVNDGESLRSRIQGKWSFFSNHQASSIILNEVLPKLKTHINSATDPVDYIGDIKDNYSYWAELKHSLKRERRFITDIEYLRDELGWDGFFETQGQLGPEEELFRARVHHASGEHVYDPEEMMCPAPHLVKGGRANPAGIPYLYLSDNKETVLYEVRASYLDEISVATIKVKDDVKVLKIADFTEDTPLFQPEKVNKTIKAKLLRELISADLSKPMRRYDSELEYIPTQFICEFIKVHAGVSGIKFQSSLHPSGKNVVIFDQELMKCTDVVLEQVYNVGLKSRALNN